MITRKMFCCRKTDAANKNTYEFGYIYIHQKNISPFRLFARGEKRGIKSALVRLNFYLITKGKAMLFSAYNQENELLHTSAVIPKCYKYSFCDREDYVIGPCQTVPAHRGKGIYPYVIRYIMEVIGSADTVFYMFSAHDNEKSIRGIQKAGFIECGTIRRVGLLKKFIRQGEPGDEDSRLEIL